MVDPEAVARRLREIDRRLAKLAAIRERGREAFLRDADLWTLAERHLQLAIQSAIDVASHLLAEQSAVTPEGYGETFALLAGEGIIDANLAARLRSAAGLRNILVHGYLDVDPALLWAQLAELTDLERFALEVARYLEGI